jgi:hypothetical protein
VREELRRKMGDLSAGVKTVVLQGPPRARFRDRTLVFDLRQEGGADGPSVEIPRSLISAMDVRDKGFLQAMRKAKRQDRWLWNGVLGFLAAFMVLAIFEVALFAGRHVVQRRQEQVRVLQPEVDRIMQEQALAFRLEELSENRLMPFELLGFINQIRPRSIQFTRLETTGHRSVRIRAQTPNSQDVGRLEGALQQSEGVQDFTIGDQRDRGGQTTFTLDLTVTPQALQRLTAPPPAAGRGVLPVPTRDGRAPAAAVTPDGDEANPPPGDPAAAAENPEAPPVLEDGQEANR